MLGMAPRRRRGRGSRAASAPRSRQTVRARRNGAPARSWRRKFSVCGGELLTLELSAIRRDGALIWLVRGCSLFFVPLFTLPNSKAHGMGLSEVEVPVYAMRLCPVALAVQLAPRFSCGFAVLAFYCHAVSQYPRTSERHEKRKKREERQASFSAKPVRFLFSQAIAKTRHEI